MGILFVVLVQYLVTDLDPNTVLMVPMLESREKCNLIDNRDLNLISTGS